MAIDHSPTIPQIWNDFITKALRAKRENRFSSAEDMLNSLRKISPLLLSATHQAVAAGEADAGILPSIPEPIIPDEFKVPPSGLIES